MSFYNITGVRLLFGVNKGRGLAGLGLEIISHLVKFRDHLHQRLIRVLTTQYIMGGTIRGVQIRAGAVYMYMYEGTCAILVAHATHT